MLLLLQPFRLVSGGFVLKEGTTKSSSLKHHCSPLELPEISLREKPPNKPMPGAADRQVIAIGVVELDEVLAIAEDAVARRLLAARNAQRFTVPEISKENFSMSSTNQLVITKVIEEKSQKMDPVSPKIPMETSSF